MREKAPRRVSPFLAWGDFHPRSRFARSTIPEEKWGTTRSLMHLRTRLVCSEIIYIYFEKVRDLFLQDF